MEHTTSTTNINSVAQTHRNGRLDNTLKFSLSSQRLFRLDGDGRGTKILCTGGELWITQEGDPYDHVLKCGEQFVITNRGVVIVQGWPEGKVQISRSRLN
jgi:hypothetical protein